MSTWRSRIWLLAVPTIVAACGEKAVAGFDREIHTEPLSTLRYVRIRDDKAAEWSERLIELAREFTTEERGGATTYGLVLGLYSTDRPHLATQVDE